MTKFYFKKKESDFLTSLTQIFLVLRSEVEKVCTMNPHLSHKSINILATIIQIAETTLAIHGIASSKRNKKVNADHDVKADKEAKSDSDIIINRSTLPHPPSSWQGL